MKDLKDLFPKSRGHFKALPQEKKIQEAPAIPKGSNRITKLILTGNETVDRVQQAIKYHQDNGIRLRSIALMPRLFHQFFDFMNREFVKRTKGKAELDPLSEIVFYDVTIKKGSALQRGPMYFEDYYSTLGQTETTFDEKIRPKFSGLTVTGKGGDA